MNEQKLNAWIEEIMQAIGSDSVKSNIELVNEVYDLNDIHGEVVA